MGINIKVAQQGFDAKTAADHQLLFSSGWPTLKLHKAASFSVLTDGTKQTVVAHSLGYSPVYWVFTNGPLGTEPQLYPFLFTVDGTNLYIEDSSFPNTITGYYYIFRQNLESKVTSDLISATSRAKNSADDYRFKVARSGKNVASNDFRDLSADSAGRTLNIHRMDYATEAGVSWSKTVSHGLGYTPFYLVYINDAGTAGWQLVTGKDQIAFTYADIDVIEFGAISSAGTKWSYIIFKDPYSLSA